MSADFSNDNHMHIHLIEQLKQRDLAFKDSLINQKRKYDKIILEKDQEICNYVTSLIDKNMILQNKNKKHEARIDFLEHKIEIYQQTLPITSNHNTNEAFLKKIQSFVSIYETQLNQTNQEYVLNQSNLKEEYEIMNSAINSIDKGKLKIHIMSFQSKILHLYDTMHTKDVLILNLTQKNDSLSEENTHIKSIILQEKLSVIEELNNMRQTTSNDIKAAMGKIMNNIQMTKVKVNEEKEKIDKRQQGMDELKAELEAKIIQNKALRDEINSLYKDDKITRKQINEYSQILSEKTIELESNQKVIRDKDLSLNVANEEIKILKNKIEELVKDNEIKDNQLNIITTELQMKIAISNTFLDKDINNENNIHCIKHLKQEIIDMETINNDLQNKNEVLNEQVINMTRQLSQSEQTIKGYKEEIVTLKESTLKNDQTIQHNDKTIEELNSKNQLLNGNLLETQKKLSHLKEIGEQSINTHNNLLEYKTKNNLLTGTQIELNKQLEEYKSKLQQTQNDLSQLKVTNYSDKAKISSLICEKGIMEKDYQRNKDQLSNKNKELEDLSRIINSIYVKFINKSDSKSIDSSLSQSKLTDLSKLQQLDNGIDIIINSLNAIKGMNEKILHYEDNIKALKQRVASLININNPNPNISKINTLLNQPNLATGQFIERLVKEMLLLNKVHQIEYIKYAQMIDNQYTKDFNLNKDSLNTQIQQIEKQIQEESTALNSRLSSILTREDAESFMVEIKKQYEYIISALFETLLEFKVDVGNQAVVILQIPTDKYNEMIETTSESLKQVEIDITKWLGELCENSQQIEGAIDLLNKYLH